MKCIKENNSGSVYELIEMHKVSLVTIRWCLKFWEDLGIIERH